MHGRSHGKVRFSGLFSMGHRRPSALWCGGWRVPVLTCIYTYFAAAREQSFQLGKKKVLVEVTLQVKIKNICILFVSRVLALKNTSIYMS